MSSSRARTLVLTPHPSESCDAVQALQATVTRHPDGLLAVRYTVAGDPNGLRIPPARPPRRTDDLWRHTCCEAFIAPDEGASYLEFNFSPSGEWASYRFTAYRAGRTDHPESASVAAIRGEEALTLEASARLGCLRGEAPVKVALAAVIEESNGRLSHWALRHPTGRPDFHHPDGFALQI
jgi:hypothetical protein